MPSIGLKFSASSIRPAALPCWSNHWYCPVGPGAVGAGRVSLVGEVQRREPAPQAAEPPASGGPAAPALPVRLRAADVTTGAGRRGQRLPVQQGRRALSAGG